MSSLKYAVFAALLLSFFLPPLELSAASDVLRWDEVELPGEGEAGGYALAPGTDVRLLAAAADGALFACISGAEPALLKSVDGGYHWTAAGNLAGEIVAVAPDSQDADLVYVATTDGIYRSSNGGQSFFPLSALALSSGADITSLNVARLQDGSVALAVGARDIDSGQYGGVYLLQDKPFAAWQGGVSGLDVSVVAFSPDLAGGSSLVAVATDETEVKAVSFALDGASVIEAVLAGVNQLEQAEIAFSPFGGVFVAVDSGAGDGDVFRVEGSSATDLGVASAYGLASLDIGSLASNGSFLLAGEAGSSQVYVSRDGGSRWEKADRNPSGESIGQLVFSGGICYAATGGSASAVSRSEDGSSFVGISLIDTRIEAVLDMAVSPRFDEDGTIFVLTWGDGFSLWRGQDGLWQRLLASSAGTGSLELVEVSPHFGSGSDVVYVVGNSDGQPTLWRSADGGESFVTRRLPMAADCLAVADDSTLFAGAFDGSGGLVYRSNNGGVTFRAASVGSQSLKSIAVSPGFAADGSILVGSTGGRVYLSVGNCASFTQLPSNATTGPLSGGISVALGTYFSQNGLVYAASDSPQASGVFRLAVGEDNTWQALDDGLPSGAMFGGLKVSENGIVYASNFQQVDSSLERGGMERSFNGYEWDRLADGLEDGATLWGLWHAGGRLWSIDTTHNRVMTLNDTLAAAPRLVAPADGAAVAGGEVSLDWDSVPGASGYRWQLDDDKDFSSPLEAATGSSRASLSELEPDEDYFWRVQVTAPLPGPWSEVWSFSIVLPSNDEPLQEPEAIVVSLVSPGNGSTGVPLRPVFVWAVSGGNPADYELLVSRDIAFQLPVISGAGISSLTWQSNAELEYGSVYYWKVRADGGQWSAAAVFVTLAAPVATTPGSTTSPPVVVQNIASEELLYALLILGGIIAILLVALIIVAVSRGRRS